MEILTASDRRAALQRPAQRDGGRVATAVRDIIETVRRGGDAALIDYTEQFDGVRLDAFAVGGRSSPQPSAH